MDKSSDKIRLLSFFGGNELRNLEIVWDSTRLFGDGRGDQQLLWADTRKWRTRRDNQSSDGAVCPQYELRKESKAATGKYGIFFYMNRDCRCYTRGYWNLNSPKNKKSFEKPLMTKELQKSSTEEVQDEENHEESVRLSIWLVSLSRELSG